jgi:hypothetical protein
MSNLVVPEWVARNEHRRRVLEESEHIRSERRYWDPLLQALDHRLSLKKARTLNDAKVPPGTGT